MRLFVKIDKDTVDMELLNLRSVLRTKTKNQVNKDDFDVIGRQTASYGRDLGPTLISILDRLLNDQEIQLNTIKTFQLEATMGEDSTAFKIVQAFLAGLGLTNQEMN